MEKLTYTHNDAAAKALAAFYETPPLAYVRSYGCQQNVNDGEKIKGVLQDVGYGLCDNVEHADLILFNTCAVREHAEQRVFGNVGALKKLKEQNPRLMIGVCGCMAQQPAGSQHDSAKKSAVPCQKGQRTVWAVQQPNIFIIPFFARSGKLETAQIFRCIVGISANRRIPGAVV